MKHLLSVVFLLAILPLTACAQQNESDRKSNARVEPFKIIGNIYYVGAADVTSFLITTPEGHFLLDSGFPETVPQIRENVKRLGFKLEDVKYTKDPIFGFLVPMSCPDVPNEVLSPASSWNDKKYCVPIAFMAMALCVLVSGCAKKTQALGSPEKEEKIAERAAAQLHTSRVLFNGGNESIYHSFRIPTAIASVRQ